MQYLGGKARLAKHLIPLIKKFRKPDSLYVEPFCGGCNILYQVPGKRIANDSHYYLIKLFF